MQVGHSSSTFAAVSLDGGLYLLGPGNKQMCPLLTLQPAPLAALALLAGEGGCLQLPLTLSAEIALEQGLGLGSGLDL